MRNNSILGEGYYLQIHGTAMGTKIALSDTNLFMGKLETHLLEVGAKKNLISGGGTLTMRLPSGHMTRVALINF